ncbi:MAG: Hsp70 family protein [Thermoguttaceae bacterium]|nr:Hsp70 family protein [Thermoguttaceae bacterium]MDW8079279.1 Hsp70 family protein [Thermoguttaceae bacterium]
MIDLDIVLKIFVPQLLREHKLPDFTMDNPRWRAAFAKMKYAAEEAKIALSSREEIWVHIPQLDRKLEIDFSCTVSRQAVTEIAMPYLLRSVTICRQGIEQSHLRPQDLDAVVLVGGPSKMPVLRELLADPKEGLGIRLEYRINPLTVVAFGAALFAGTQILNAAPSVPVSKKSPGGFRLEVDYKPIGPDDMPIVKGRIAAPAGQSLEGWSVEFSNVTSDIGWRSGKVPVTKENAFVAVLWAERGKRNEFRIELYDPHGVIHSLTPNVIPYTIAAVASQPPLTHSVGLALADGSVAILCPKGTPLPTRKEDIRRTTVTLRRGESGKLVAIPLVEGENRTQAHRNRLIGRIEIRAQDVEQDVPWGTEVQIVVEIDASRLVTARAFVPLLKRSFEKVIHRSYQVWQPLRPNLSRKRIGWRALLTRLRPRAIRMHAWMCWLVYKGKIWSRWPSKPSPGQGLILRLPMPPRLGYWILSQQLMNWKRLPIGRNWSRKPSRSSKNPRNCWLSLGQASTMPQRGS